MPYIIFTFVALHRIVWYYHILSYHIMLYTPCYVVPCYIILHSAVAASTAHVAAHDCLRTCIGRCFLLLAETCIACSIAQLMTSETRHPTCHLLLVLKPIAYYHTLLILASPVRDTYKVLQDCCCECVCLGVYVRASAGL